ncbi:MAG: TatD family hydrolase [Gammaproteobacteria bacterium]
MKLVDSHCHLPLIADEARSVSEIVAAAHASGVIEMLCVGVQIETIEEVLHAASEHEHVFASVGVHPNTEQDAFDPSVDDLIDWVRNHDKVIAVGETGLDYFRSSGDLAWQKERFRTHIRAAKELSKPIIIHTRDASADTLQIMREENAAQVGGVMHCFVEDYETASAAMDMGFYISFSGIVTFKSATDLQAVAKRIPLERMLVETDSPWLAPVPKRGKTNEPAFVQYTAKFLADLRGEHPETLAEVTTSNYQALFH